ncbi:MAG: formyltransferase family protein [Bacteroidota bacterium]
MKIGFLSNSSLGIPTLQALLTQGSIHRLGLSLPLHPPTENMQLLAQKFQIPIHHIDKQGQAAQLTEFCQDLDLVMVVGHPWKIPASCLSLPTDGFVNFHFAPLPSYRGAEPLFWVLKNQEAQNGLVIHQMNEQFDQGHILYEVFVQTNPLETLGQHMGRLSMAAIDWTKDFLRQYQAGQLKGRQQDASAAQYWPKPESQDLVIQWSEYRAADIQALVKAANPHYGGAISYYQGLPFRILELSIIPSNPQIAHLPPGTILNAANNMGLFVHAQQGELLRIDVVKLEEGYFPGWKLFELGVQAGQQFTSS